MARRRKLFKLKLRPETIRGIIAIGLAVFSGLVLLSTFAPQGAMMERFHEIFVGQFSLWGAPIFAVILLQMASLLSGIKAPFSKPNIIIGTTFIFASLISISRSGSLGDGIFQTIYSVLPINIAVFLILLGVALFGLTVFLNLTLGEAIEVVTDTIKSMKEFFKKYLNFKKKVAPEFVKDNLVKDSVFKNFKDGSLSDKKPTQSGNINANHTTSSMPPVENSRPSELNSRIIQNEKGEQIIWEYPSLDLLPETSGGKADRGDPKQNAHTIEKTLESFGVKAQVVEVNPGPAITQYALEIALGTKLSKITALQNDLALALAAPGQIRVEAPIPGRSLVGVEIPNHTPEFVTLRQILKDEKFQKTKNKLTVALGLDVSGNPQFVDISKMPHTLIAGSTGSGKSVCINTFLISLLFHNAPNELKLILVDPKRVELSLYQDIPHLLTPVIVDLDKVLSSLKWAISEMERRYKTFASVAVRNIESYNEVSGFQAMPYIVIVIDEMADLMMFSPKEVEDAICRLAQMARATGIHLVLATQSPRVDVITGLIKANIPCRIAFNVTSMIDSRVIIDSPGAERLLGKGDMLYIPPDQSKPSRIQGAFVSEKEVKKVVEYLKSKGAPVQYTQEVTSMPLIHNIKGSQTGSGGDDEMVKQAIKVIVENNTASASFLQRKLSIGYSRAARIIDILQERGIVSAPDSSKSREVLIRNVDEYFAKEAAQETPAQ